MKISVINLAGDPMRWLAVRAAFDAAGLVHIERHEATCGTDMTTQQSSARYCSELNRKRYHRPLRPGEIGCYESHLALWRRLAASNLPCMAIFEDDVELSPQLPLLLDAIAGLPTGWDMVKLIGRRHEKVVSSAPLVDGHRLIQYRRVPSLTGGYVLSREGARKLIETRQRFGRPVDVDLRHWWECDLHVVGLHPYPVRQAPMSLRTTIDGRVKPRDLWARLHKLVLQLKYSLLNGAAGRARAATQALPEIPSMNAMRTRPDAGSRIAKQGRPT